MLTLSLPRNVSLPLVSLLGCLGLALAGCPDEVDPGTTFDVVGSTSQTDTGPDTGPVPDDAETTGQTGDEGTTAADDEGTPDDEGTTTTGEVDTIGEDVEPECTSAEDCTELVVAACQQASCDNGECGVAEQADLTPCDDGDACTAQDQCQAGLCGGTPVDCNDDNECTLETCEAETGACLTTLADGPCDDGDDCTANTQCAEGDCTGGEIVCECITTEDCAGLEDGNACNGTLTCVGNECVVDPKTIVTCDPGLGTTCLDNECNTLSGACELIAAPAGKNCNDGNVCTTGDSCLGGVCTGDVDPCDDENPCTDDSCNAAKGCVNKAGSEGEGCNDENACTADDVCTAGQCGGGDVNCDDGNPCTDDSCDSGSGCSHIPNGASCDDGNECTINDACVGATCSGGGPSDCNDKNPCTDDGCTPGEGCTHDANSVPCNDLDPCTLSDICFESSCTGVTFLECNDNNPCTDDSCQKGSGCQFKANVAPCNDGNGCSTADTCAMGVCNGGPSTCECETNADCAPFEDEDQCNGTLICDKNSFPFGCKVDLATVVACDSAGDTPCLKNQCSELTGTCSLTAQDDGIACNDGNACSTTDTCNNGTCFGEGAADCDDGQPCTVDTCDAAGGCVHTAASDVPCNDDNACTTLDLCQSGACVGSEPPDCDDDNVCTLDLCEAQGGCQNIPVGLPCNDDDPCTSSDACIGGTCLGKATVDCNDDNVCTTDSCNTDAGGCVNEPTEGVCDDANACTTDTTCNDAGGCGGGQPLDCDDKNPCTTDLCDPTKGCLTQPNEAPCDDLNACTAGDHCALGVCQFASSVVCNDLNPCTTDACDATDGCVTANNTAPCDDENPCTNGDVCSGGDCAGTLPTNCNDGNPCTDDGCDADGGCTNTPNQQTCDDGDACTKFGICTDGVCTKGDDQACNDGNPCTTDTCVADEGCVFTNNSGACNDENSCTVGDVCAEGVCQPGADSLDCADDNPCTTDGCNPDSGCSYSPSGASCNDGNPCTEVDACQGFVCVGSGLSGCDDGNPCTDDSCDPDTGCVHVANEDPCDDGDACTTPGKCVDTVCEKGSAVAFCCEVDTDCNDGSACTNDVCLENACQNTPFGTTHFEEGFDDGVADGFEFETDNELVGFQLDTANPLGGTHSLYWGNPNGYSYDFGETLSEATLTQIDVPYGPAILSFSLFMDVEDKTDCDFDVLSIYVDNAFVHEECEATLGWKRVHIDLSAFAGRSVDVTFVMETGDDEFNDGQGLWIDSMVLTQGDCDGSACTEHAECADEALCSGGLCIDGTCRFKPSPPNQSFGENFDDIPAVAGNGAAQGWSLTSTNSELAWHVSNAKAYTGTQSLYAANAAAGTYDFGAGTISALMPKVRIANNAEVTLAFRLSMDVADQTCATDVLNVKVGNKILKQFCQSTGDGFVDVGIVMNEFFAQDVQPRFEFVAGGNSGAAKGVFIEDVAILSDIDSTKGTFASTCGFPQETFDDAFPFNFMTESTNADIYWHISTKQKFSGTRSMHCANPTTHKYFGTATDCQMTVAVTPCPAGKLNFRLRNTVQDQSCNADIFTVEVGDDELLQKCNNTSGFQQQSVDLSAYVGLTVPVTFRFTSDDVTNNAEGAYVDQVIVSCE